MHGIHWAPGNLITFEKQDDPIEAAEYFMKNYLRPFAPHLSKRKEFTAEVWDKINVQKVHGAVIEETVGHLSNTQI